MSPQEPENPSAPHREDAPASGESKSMRLRAVHSSNPKGTRFKPKAPAGEAGKPESGEEPPEEVKPTVEWIEPEEKRPFKVKPLAVAIGVLGFFGVLMVFGIGFGAGQWWLKRELAKQEEGRMMEFSAVARERMSQAMGDLREGKAKEALVAFQAMGQEFPHVPSLNYLSAVAAMQAGEADLAEALLAKSLEARERESDAYALQAILETQRTASRSKISLGDPTLRSEKLLWRAVLADPANPLPFIELATLMRYKGRHDEAQKALEAARARLQPVDSHVVVEVTLALVRLEGMPTDKLAEGDAASDNVNTLMPAAYVALRKENFDQAAEMLKRCRGLMPGDLYDYLVNDPAFRKFSYRAELKTAFQH